jgi:GR25 family glycosyltransferase involved in LPS biosynthesis
MINEFFDRVVVLTTARRERCQAELDKYGIKADFFQSIADPNPFRSFNISQKAILRDFTKSEDHNILVLEDDVVFQNMEMLEIVLDELDRTSWDIVYFGGNYKNHDKAVQPEVISTHLRRIYNAWTTHAIAYTRDVAQNIYRRYGATHLYDAWLDENILEKWTAVATVPMLAIQEKGHSALWGREVDYTGTWSQSIDFIR